MNESTMFDDIPPFPVYLKEIRDHYVNLITDSGQREAASKAVDSVLGSILAELNAPIPNARWVLMEYVGGYDSEKQDLFEHTRPASFIVQDYCDQVNG